ncbi:hypothetical protein GM661_00320 [Iocasia frigidifontis]|uniref:IrrE N-terminal-like domain-containing protein n=1 Tax=Iocasia fonsfrigidae TaxID=2682810 RepID=A0A8A7KAG6_9FIRM|nr:hypothetical protein [Iocasia fonsfrigidae]QTL96518.1 hypothetical protein GM661_00320 [Iocasia fonsfrigidae]
MNQDAKNIRTSLQRAYIGLQQIARSNNIFHRLYALKSGLWGFVYKSRFDSYIIIINKNLSTEMQKEVYLHEVEHILYDMPDVGYFIGLDMQYSTIENEADDFAKAVMEAANYF